MNIRCRVELSEAERGELGTLLSGGKAQRNAAAARINWMFTTQLARLKMLNA